MRACPFCAEQIQDAAILCRFCGRDVPTGRSESSPSAARPRLPMRRYVIDERVKRATTNVDPRRRPSTWAKLGGLEDRPDGVYDVWSNLRGWFDVHGPRERRGRSGERESMFREYTNVKRYKKDVARLVRAGWEIDQQVDRLAQEKIVVRWIREPH